MRVVLAVVLLGGALLVPQVPVSATVIVENVPITTVDGTQVTAVVGIPPDPQVDTLVVFAHGYGHTVEASWTPHVAETAGHGVVAIAMNYRDNLGFPVLRGAYDLIAATEYALDRFETIDRVILFSVSMGSAIGGTALAERPDLFHLWIDVEGVSNLFETYAEARAVGHGARHGIERDANGSPDQVPLEYVRRSPALRATEFNIPAAILVHPLNDGLVPYNQGREMQAALLGAGIVVEYHTVLRGSGSRPDTQGTTALGLPNPLGLAGHANEADRQHPVMVKALERLFDVIDGCPVEPGEGVVDTELNASVGDVTEDGC